MNYLNFKFIDNNSMGASFNSSPLLLVRCPSSTIQLSFTGSPSGTFKLQSSSDVTFEKDQITTWDDIPDSSQVISAAGTHTWSINLRFKWIRVVYVRTSGTGSCDGTLFAAEAVR